MLLAIESGRDKYNSEVFGVVVGSFATKRCWIIVFFFTGYKPYGFVCPESKTKLKQDLYVLN